MWFNSVTTDFRRSIKPSVASSKLTWLSGRQSKTKPDSIILELQQILSQLDNWEDIMLAYKNALPKNYDLWYLLANVILTQLVQLQQFDRLDKFVAELTQNQNIPQSVKDKLNQFSPEFQPQQEAQIPLDNKLDSYLQIVIEPSLSSKKFELKAWLIPDNKVQELAKRYEPLDIDDQSKVVKCNLEEIPEYVEQLIKLSLSYLRGQKHDLTLEFFLPLELLGKEVDFWEIPRPSNRKRLPIGTKYKVILRSLERLDLYYIDSMLNDWYDNWDRFKHKLDEHPCTDDFEHLDDIYNCPSDDEYWNNFTDKLIQKLGLKLTCEVSINEHQELFDSMINAAIPIAIWTRKKLTQINPTAQIDSFLMNNCLRTLPDCVKEQRKNAYLKGNRDNHIGYHLALLWEDPYRLTPDIMAQFQPPLSSEQ